MHVRNATCMLILPTFMFDMQYACRFWLPLPHHAPCPLHTIYQPHAMRTCSNLLDPLALLVFFVTIAFTAFRRSCSAFLGCAGPGVAFRRAPAAASGGGPWLQCVPRRATASSSLCTRVPIHGASIHSLAPRRCPVTLAARHAGPPRAPGGCTHPVACHPPARRAGTVARPSPSRTARRPHWLARLYAALRGHARRAASSEGPGAPRPPLTSRGLAGRQSGARHAPARHRAARRLRSPTLGRRTLVAARGFGDGGNTANYKSPIPASAKMWFVQHAHCDLKT